MIYRNLLSCILVILFFGQVEGRAQRVNQIPNGDVGGCGNCHVNSAGGGARNAFGSAIEGGFLSGGNVTWNATLARLDSDQDGATNGAGQRGEQDFKSGGSRYPVSGNQSWRCEQHTGAHERGAGFQFPDQ